MRRLTKYTLLGEGCTQITGIESTQTSTIPERRHREENAHLARQAKRDGPAGRLTRSVFPQAPKSLPHSPTTRTVATSLATTATTSHTVGEAPHRSEPPHRRGVRRCNVDTTVSTSSGSVSACTPQPPSAAGTEAPYHEEQHEQRQDEAHPD